MTPTQVARHIRENLDKLPYEFPTRETFKLFDSALSWTVRSYANMALRRLEKEGLIICVSLKNNTCNWRKPGPPIVTVWTHEICYCRHESGFTVQSVHSERRAAIRAMLETKRARVEERLRFRDLYGKRRGDLYDVQPDFDAQLVRGIVVDGGFLPKPLCVEAR